MPPAAEKGRSRRCAHALALHGSIRWEARLKPLRLYISRASQKAIPLVRHRHTTPRPPPRDPCAPYGTHGHEPLIDRAPGRTIARIRHRCDGLPDTGVANRVEGPWPTLVSVSPSEKPLAETRTGPRRAHASPLAMAAGGHRASPSGVERAMRSLRLPQPARLPTRTLAAR